MRRFIAVGLAYTFGVTQTFGAVRGDRAAYIGGTASLKQGTQGSLNVSDRTEMVFSGDGSILKIPYQSVTSLEFGQKIGRRVGATVALGVTTLGIGALPILFSKKKRHYLTVGYVENGANQAAIFELAKDIVRPTLATLEARTGKPVERDDTADLDKPKESVERVAPVSSLPPSPVVTAPPPTAPPSGADRPVMTNADVVKMVQSGVSQDIVLAAIRNCQPRFGFLPAQMDAMMKAGVTEQIIKAMAARQNNQ